MLKIRLARTGAKKAPSYRLVVSEARTPQQGKTLDIVGHYHPLSGRAAFTLDQEKIKKWLSQGAQPTETVARLLSDAGLLEKPQPSSAPAQPVPKAEP